MTPDTLSLAPSRSRQNQKKLAAFVLMGVAGLLLSACSGGGSGDQPGGGAFLLLKTQPANNGRIFLNQNLAMTFTNPIDLDTVNFNSIAFSVFDLSGKPLTEQVVGTFGIGRNENGDKDDKVLEFRPRLPSNDSYTNGGFKPGRTYVVSFVGSANRAAPTVRDAKGRVLSKASPIKSLRFRTASGTTPRELFLDTQIGGPRVVSTTVGPKVGNRVALNYLGGVPVEVKIRFNQPLNPASTNVPLRQDRDPLNHQIRNKGRIYMEYDDPEFGKRQWIRAAVEMPDNDSSGATVVLRPDGVLPNNAEIRVIVEADLEDISGESNVKDSSYNPVIFTFKTEEAFNSQFDAISLNLLDKEMIDQEAAFRDPVAEIKNGILQAAFNFEGLDTPFDFGPLSKEIVLNTDFTTVTPKNGPPITVSGGVFHFRNIEVPEGVTVRGIGSNPLVFLATGSVEIRGTLKVDGGNGARVDTLNSANFPTAGGIGACGGGNGGKGSPRTGLFSAAGEDGFGPGQVPSGGGQGGAVDCTGFNKGGGGGGGSFATQGDPDYYDQYKKGTSNQYKIIEGFGGLFGATSQKRANPGVVPFVDPRKDNDFWGRQVTDNGKVITGELVAPIGGQGGGGGGDRSSGARCSTGSASYINDEKGAGGGGGAGVLIIKALGRITVTQSGRISADGGNGGGGECAGSSRMGGSGGGGTGGMVILQSATGIDLVKHGDTWSSGSKPWNQDFSVTADGGIGTHTGRKVKYLSAGSWSAGLAGNNGGFGGMGVVQFMTPPGTDADGTGTVQDDNIRILDANGKPVPGAEKTKYLFGGDVRPNPYLMPVPFGRFSQIRTNWIETGASVRREVTSTTAGPRAILAPGLAGPEYFFNGIIKSGKAAGYIRTDPKTGNLDSLAVTIANGKKNFPVVATRSKSQTIRGTLVHEIEFAQAILPTDGRYANYRVRLFGANKAQTGEFRIVGHTSKILFVDASEGALPNDVAAAEVHAKFFEVVTKGSLGLGPVYRVDKQTTTEFYPLANVQIGFAFHKSPWAPKYDNVTKPTKDDNRFPTKLGDFVFDLESTGASSARELLRQKHYPYVQMKVRFNLSYDYKDPDLNTAPTKAGPNTLKPGIRFLLLPYRF